MSGAQIHKVYEGKELQCATWLIEGSSGVALVDPGSGNGEETILAHVERLGFEPAQITHLLITHAHVDHCLGAGKLRKRIKQGNSTAPLSQTRDSTGESIKRQKGAVVASETTAKLLESAAPPIWGEHPDLIPAISVDVRVQDMESIDVCGLTVICVLTPGHMAGSTTYIVETEAGPVGFTGDLLFQDSTPGWAGEGQYSPQQTLASLEKLSEFELAKIYPGHGRPIDDVEDWIMRGLDLGRAGEWSPTSEWQAEDVPPNVKQ